MIDLSKYKDYKYSSMRYLEQEDIDGASIFYEDASCIVMYKETKKVEVMWATNAFISLMSVLKRMKQCYDHKAIYIEFIPAEYINEMKTLGFEVYSEYADFWIRTLIPSQKLSELYKIQEMTASDSNSISQVTLQCKGQSRGFEGESVKMIGEWIVGQHSKVFGVTLDNKIVGIIMTKLYGFDSEKGPVVWVRLLAVSPEYQGRGIGEALLKHAMKWGMDHGAKRSFLHADVHNDRAIHMYQRNGFQQSDGASQINMILKG